MTNSADPGHLASEEANWSGSTLQMLGKSWFSRARVKKNCKLSKQTANLAFVKLWQDYECAKESQLNDKIWKL